MKTLFNTTATIFISSILFLLGISQTFANSEIIIFQADHYNREIIHGAAGDDTTLYFGDSLSKSLQWDNSETSFIFSHNINFSGNEITNVRLENNTVANKTCNTSHSGEIYYDTTTSLSSICNGTSWRDIDNSNVSPSGLKAYFDQIDTANISQNETKDITISGGNFTPLMIFQLSSGAILNYTIINSDSSATLNVTGGTNNASINIISNHFFGNILSFLVQ